MKTTYHARSGRFCKSDAAAKVVKGGEQFQVVRQHRRVKKKPAVEQSLPSSKWMPMSDVLSALGVTERRDRPRISRPQKCKYCDSPATKALIWAEGRAYVPVCDDEHLAKARKRVGEKGVAVRPIPVG